MSAAKALLLFGPPGAGKGTQAAALSAASGLPHIATGDMFRAHLAQGSELGQQAKGYMNRGALVPDEVTIGMLTERIAEPDAEHGFLLDGFPRNIAQAEALGSMLSEQSALLAGVLSLEVPDDELVKRIAGRRSCSVCGESFHVEFAPPPAGPTCERGSCAVVQRDDDREPVVRGRLEVFHGQTRPVLAYYREQGAPVKTIDGNRSRDAVEADLTAALRELLA